jgi:CheY-like chemotaxis protein
MEVPHTYRWNKKNILVVEDDESSAFLLNEMLKETGATLEFITDGRQAVEYFKANPHTDLILMDVHLPEKDGFTATREIKAISNDVVVIAQTSYAHSVDILDAEKAGCDAFLTKPINCDLLLGKIDSFLS